MKLYVGITDYDWFKTLKREKCDEVNFWKPGGKAKQTLKPWTKETYFSSNCTARTIILSAVASS